MNQMAMRRVGKFAACLCVVASLLLARPAAAAELAVLRNGFSILHDHRKIIGDTTRLFVSRDDSNFTDVPTAEITGYEKDLSLPVPAQPVSSPPPLVTAPIPIHSAPDLEQVVNSASAAYHLDPDLVNTVIHAESGFNPHAVSPKGARGLMQLMPSTASALGVRDVFDPEANVGGGSRYLRELLERYNFDLVKALAAYNAGPERVEQYRGVPPFYETRAYVARIVHEYNRKKIAQEKAAAKVHKREEAEAKKASASHRKEKTRSTPPANAAARAPQHALPSAAQLAASSATATPSAH
ncbi:MAG: lytic transglycosylase domain-containing protein [Terriglobales bacterium]